MRWSSIRVGGLAELVLVAMPLAALAAVLTLSFANTTALRDRLADNPTFNAIHNAAQLPERRR